MPKKAVFRQKFLNNFFSPASFDFECLQKLLQMKSSAQISSLPHFPEFPALLEADYEPKKGQKGLFWAKRVGFFKKV